MKYCFLYLPWPPWVAQLREDYFYLCQDAQSGKASTSVLLLHVIVNGVIALTFTNVNTALMLSIVYVACRS